MKTSNFTECCCFLTFLTLKTHAAKSSNHTKHISKVTPAELHTQRREKEEEKKHPRTAVATRWIKKWKLICIFKSIELLSFFQKKDLSFLRYCRALSGSPCHKTVSSNISHMLHLTEAVFFHSPISRRINNRRQVLFKMFLTMPTFLTYKYRYFKISG